MKVYNTPGSTVRVERNQKVAKRIHTALRNRCGIRKFERQIAVALNTVNQNTISNTVWKRHKFDIFIARNDQNKVDVPGTSAIIDSTHQSSEAKKECDNLTYEEVMEQDSFLASVLRIKSLEDIPDNLLFHSS